MATAGFMGNRWLQLAVGFVAMVMVANLQYAWTLFVGPIDARHGWGRPAIQVAFSIFVVIQTALAPGYAWLADRFGPRPVVACAGVLVGCAWIIDALAASLTTLYMGAAVAGVGGAVVQLASVGNALKWFPDRRGLAVGVTMTGYGMGAVFTAAPIAGMIETAGYQVAFLTFGLIQGALVMAAGVFMRSPPLHSSAAPTATAGADADLSPERVLRTPIFYLLYLMLTMVAAGGLMIVAQLAPMARDFGIDGASFTLAGLTIGLLPLALSTTRVLDGLGRTFFGWISDHIGRENTMFAAFLLEALATACLLFFGPTPIPFVLLCGAVFFAWGEIFSLFPAMSGDLFGQRFATTNWGMLYTAKGAASLLVPLGSWLSAGGGWTAVLATAAVLDVVAALLALLVLKPLRLRGCATAMEPSSGLHAVLPASLPSSRAATSVEMGE